jgi:ATP-binding cassette subfamily B protein
MADTITALAWPQARLAEGMEELARAAGLKSTLKSAEICALADENVLDLERWLVWAGNRIGLEIEAVETSFTELETLLRHASPALVEINHQNERLFLLLLKSKAGRLRVIAPDLKQRDCPVEWLINELCAKYETPVATELNHILQVADIPKSQQQRVRKLLLNERLAKQRFTGFWLLRKPVTSNFFSQLVHAKLLQRLMLILLVFVLVYGLEVAGWGLIGKAALNGRLDLNWLIGWFLTVLTLIPLHLLGSWLDATFALDVSQLLKKRLLAGVLQLDLDVVRYQGAGQLLGRVIEAQALESLVLNGGFTVITSTVELIFAAGILASGAGGRLHLLLLIMWLVVSMGLSWRYCRRMQAWTINRLNITHTLIEGMVGHRTRLAQESVTRRDAKEDRMMKEYLHCSKKMDDALLPVVGVISRGWLVVALMGLMPAFISGTTTTASLGVSLGGMMLANRSLSGITGGLSALARAGVAWMQVSTLFKAAERKVPTEVFLPSTVLNKQSTDGKASRLIEAKQLVFRYRTQGQPILRNTNLTINRGERILLEGVSGGGKSTLAALLIGLREPESGLLLLNGLDRHTLGNSWHKLATEAPQFHENHILTGTLAFNLLMGKNWPANSADLEQAEAICAELGLSELLQRMPAKLMQQVGETGWQLSHGERSRIFLARALLQNAQLTILDESFAALDPETLHKCLDCALRRAQTLLVIAHP